jgi:acetyl-CoA acetyltransferase
VRCDLEAVRHNDLAYALGIENLTYWGLTGPGGSAPAAQVAHAVAAVVAGHASHVLVYRSLNGRSGRRFGLPPSRSQVERVGGNGTFEELVFPYGYYTNAQRFALIARRHMIDYGTRSEDLAAIAIACRNRALANPAALMHGRPLTQESYFAARMITDPLRLNDLCLESDGACAVVISRADRALDTRHPVLIRAAAQGTGRIVAAGESLIAQLVGDSITSFPARAVADTLWRRAGFGPDEVDVAQIYDCFTISVLIQLEDYGFCKPGEGGPFASSGALELDGSLPINTAGGNLSEAYVHGMNHVVEGVKQLRGESTGQTDSPQTCLVTSGIFPGCSAVVLRRA